MISLITASFAILVKQWLHEYMARETQAPLLSLLIRFFRTEGLTKWQVFEIAAALPLLLQIALLLFFIGLSEFLCQLHPVVGWVTTAVTVSWLFIFIFTTITPIFSSLCPYKTPILKRPLNSLRTLLRGGMLLESFYGSLRSIVQKVRRTTTQMATAVTFLCSHLRDLKWSTRGLCRVPYNLTLICTTWTIWTFNGPSTYLKTRPEEAEVRDSQNDALDIAIIVSSESLFLDDQLMSTIYECSNTIDMWKIVNYYYHLFKPECATPIADTWMISIMLDVKNQERIRKLIGTLLLHKSRDPKDDLTWHATLKSILEARTSGPWWDHLPTIFIQLIQSSLDFGATPVFSTLRSLLLRPELHLRHRELYARCSESMNKGDAQCTSIG